MLARLDARDRALFSRYATGPSGHSAAAMSVAVVYGLAFGHGALLLVPLAALVGVSRVRLGVHYPGDVVAGQLIAILTALIIRL